jgi:hypothetical protein
MEDGKTGYNTKKQQYETVRNIKSNCLWKNKHEDNLLQYMRRGECVKTLAFGIHSRNRNWNCSAGFCPTRQELGLISKKFYKYLFTL